MLLCIERVAGLEANLAGCYIQAPWLTGVHQQPSKDCKAYLDVPKVVNDRPLQHLLVQGANSLICYISVQALHQHRCLLCYVLLHCAQRQQIRDDDTSALLQVATERLQYPRPCLQQSKHAETPLSVQKQLLSSD